MNIGDLILRVLTDDRWQADLQKKSATTGDKAGKTLGSRMSSGIKGAFKGSKGDLLGMIGLGAGIGLATVGIGKLIGVMGDSVTAASDQREAFSLTAQVFEKNGEAMEDWASGAAQAFGQSTTEALTFASNFGNAFKNVGFSLDETADKAQTMTRLAADLGSAFNATGEEAATALRSGLLGESEPLRRFGVFLSEAAVKAEAMSSGIAKQGDVLTDNQKVLARYNIIMRQTKDSQGMFGRDTKSLADAQKRLSAAWDDAQAALGEALLPIMVEVVDFVNEEFVPAVKALGEAFGDMDEEASAHLDATGKSAMNLGDILGDVFKSRTDEAKTGVGELNDVLTDLVDNLLDSVTFWDPFTFAIDDNAKKLEKQSEAARESQKGTALVGVAAADATPAIEEMGKEGQAAGRKLKYAADTAAEAFMSWRDRVVGYARDIIDKAYQVIEDKAELTATNIELAKLRETIATGKATKEQKERYEELNHRQVELLVDLAANGVTAGKLVSDTMDSLRRRLKTATGQERVAILAAIALLNQLNAAAERARIKIQTAVNLAKLGIGSQGLIGGNWGPTGNGQATGGPVQAGRLYPVNELPNQVEYFAPSVDGTIFPNAESLGSAMGAASTYNISVPIQGLVPKLHDPRDIVTELIRLRDVGILPPRTTTPTYPRQAGT